MELSKVYCPLSKSSREVYIPHEYKDNYALKIIEISRSNIEYILHERFNIKTILKVYMVIQIHDEHKLKNLLEAQYKDSWTSL